jgi:hypothetical protein
LLFSGVRPFVVASAEAEGSSEAVAEAISVALAVAEADSDGVGVGVGVGEEAVVLVSAVGEASLEPKGRLPQAVRDRAVMGRRTAAIRRAEESFEELMARE